MSGSFLPKSGKWDENFQELKTLLHPLSHYRIDREAAKKRAKAEMVDEASMEKICDLLLYDDLLDQFAWRFATFNFDHEDFEDFLDFMVSVAHWILAVYNVSRPMDCTTVSVSSCKEAMDEYDSKRHDDDIDDDDFLVLKGFYQHKNSHFTSPRHNELGSTSTETTPIWPVMKINFLKHMLIGLERCKKVLRKRGFQVHDDCFFIDREGQPLTRNGFEKGIKLAMRALKLSFNSRDWRVIVQTKTKEKQLAACLNDPGAKAAQFALDCVTKQMHHTDKVANKYYRVNTKNVSKTAGRMVNAILMENKFQATGVIEPPSKRLRVSESSEDPAVSSSDEQFAKKASPPSAEHHPSATSHVTRGETSSSADEHLRGAKGKNIRNLHEVPDDDSDDFQPRKSKRATSIMKFVSVSNAERRIQAAEEELKANCKQAGVTYEPPTRNETPKERSARRTRCRKKIRLELKGKSS